MKDYQIFYMMKKYDVVLACGGLGTRLKKLTKDTIPKPLYLY